MGCKNGRHLDTNHNKITSTPKEFEGSIVTSHQNKMADAGTGGSGDKCPPSPQQDKSSYRLPELEKTDGGFLVPRPPPTCDLPEHIMPMTELYNLMNSGYRQPSIHDPFNLLIVDCRDHSLYLDQHIITANHISDFDDEWENVVNTGSIHRFNVFVVYGDSSEDPKVKEAYGKITMKDLYVQILEGGFEKFLSFAPFLCTNLIVSTELERMRTIFTNPSVVLEGALYQGNALQAARKDCIENLSITHIVNITTEVDCHFEEECKYLHLRYADESGEHILPIFHKAADFIAEAIQGGGKVFVHCVMGVSRSSSVTISFLMKYLGMNFKDAHDFLKDKRSVIAPNMGFTRQLCKFEKMLFGEQFTNEETILFGGRR